MAFTSTAAMVILGQYTCTKAEIPDLPKRFRWGEPVPKAKVLAAGLDTATPEALQCRLPSAGSWQFCHSSSHENVGSPGAPVGSFNAWQNQPPPSRDRTWRGDAWQATGIGGMMTSGSNASSNWRWRESSRPRAAQPDWRNSNEVNHAPRGDVQREGWQWPFLLDEKILRSKTVDPIMSTKKRRPYALSCAATQIAIFNSGCRFWQPLRGRKAQQQQADP